MKAVCIAALCAGAAFAAPASAQVVISGVFSEPEFAQPAVGSGIGSVFLVRPFQITVTGTAPFSGSFLSEAAQNAGVTFHLGDVDPFGTERLDFSFVNQYFPGNPGGDLFSVLPAGEYTMLVIYEESFVVGDPFYTVTLNGVTLGWGPSIEEQLEELGAVAAEGGRYTLRLVNSNIHDVAQRSIAKRKTPKAAAGETASLMGDVNAWVRTSAISADSDARTYDTKMFQFGADLAVNSSLVAGLAIGVGDMNADTTGFSFEGDQILIQPYVGWNYGVWRGSASLVFGDLEYDTITSVSGTAAADGEMLALSANASRDFAINEQTTLTPFVGVETGQTKLDATSGSLAGLGIGESVNYTETRLGVVMTADVGGGTLTLGASANYYDTDAPTVLTSGQFDDTGWSGITEVGYSVSLDQNTRLDANIQVGGIGTGTSSFSGALQLAITF